MRIEGIRPCASKNCGRPSGLLRSNPARAYVARINDACATLLGMVIPVVLPSWPTPVSRIRHSIVSPSSSAWERVLRTTHAIPSCIEYRVSQVSQGERTGQALTPLAYPSAAASHMRERPVGESIDSLLSVIKFTGRSSAVGRGAGHVGTHKVTASGSLLPQWQHCSYHFAAAARHDGRQQAMSCTPYQWSSALISITDIPIENAFFSFSFSLIPSRPPANSGKLTLGPCQSKK